MQRHIKSQNMSSWVLKFPKHTLCFPKVITLGYSYFLTFLKIGRGWREYDQLIEY